MKVITINILISHTHRKCSRKQAKEPIGRVDAAVVEERPGR